MTREGAALVMAAPHIGGEYEARAHYKAMGGPRSRHC
jgi:hypothetical protein